MHKVETYNFKAESFHVDCEGRLFLGVLGNNMLNAAGRHADARGFGINTLKENNYTWVLSRLAIELNTMPTDGQSVTIETWIEAVYRLFTDRNFAIKDADGKVLGYALSVWAMIDLSTRKPVDLLTMNAGTLPEWLDTERPCLCEKPGRIKCAATEAEMSYTILYNDVDINGHHNSVKYIDHILDLFPLDFLRSHTIKRFEIAFVNEGHYGERIDAFRDENNNVELKHGDDVLCRAHIDFA